MWKDKIYCLQMWKGKKMFAEKSGKIFKNIITHTEIKKVK